MPADGLGGGRRRRSPRPGSTRARPTTPGSSSAAGPRRVSTPAGWRAGAASSGDVPGRARAADRRRPCGGPRRSRPVSVERAPSGRIRLDFGQNIAGRAAHPRRAAPAGTTVTPAPRRGARGRRARHAAAPRGDLGRPLHPAPATAIETWTPRFTLHGFRYAEVEDWPGELDDGRRRGRRRATPTWSAPAGSSSDHDGLNRLHENVVWSMRDNFVDLPTDCPQRDERLGWTGDIQVFAPDRASLFDAHGTLTGWLRDLAAEQAEQGHVPNFVPWIECGFPQVPDGRLGRCRGDRAVGRCTATTATPGILAEQYASMRAWVDLVDGLTGQHRAVERRASSSATGSTRRRRPRTRASRAPTSTSSRPPTTSARRGSLAETATLLGDDDDAARYAALADAGHARRSRREYVSADRAGGQRHRRRRSRSRSCSSCFATDEQRARAGERLAAARRRAATTTSPPASSARRSSAMRCARRQHGRRLPPAAAGRAARRGCTR